VSVDDEVLSLLLPSEELDELSDEDDELFASSLLEDDLADE
jgi:hypothetical protein